MASAQERERNAAEQYRHLSAKTSTLESKLSMLSKTKLELEAKIEVLAKEAFDAQESKTKDKCEFEAVKLNFGQEIQDLKSKLDLLKVENQGFQEDLEAEKRKNVVIVDQLKDRDRRLKEMTNDLDNLKSSPMTYRAKSNSPSLASVNSEQWPDEVFESRNVGNDGLRMLIGASGSSSALLESLQSQLKQREVIFKIK